MPEDSSHEKLTKKDDVPLPPDRSFGWTFAIVFLLLAAFGFWHRGATAWFYAALALSLGFGGMTLAAPRLLRPLNKIWFKFGLLLHKIVNPVIMGLLFFGVFTPMGVAMRLFGADLLRLKPQEAQKSYWRNRADEGIPDSSMTNQF